MVMVEDTRTRDQLALERTRLANERTLLAYVRTGLTILAAGFALHEIMGGSFTPIGIVAMGVGLLTVGAGIWRFRRVAERLSRRV